MISFILNNQYIQTDAKTGGTLLDFIRYNQHLTGTKIGCREGDCGACTVLEGRYKGDRIEYRSIVSCLTPLGNAHGKHIVTIEGLNTEHLIPAQKAFVDHGGTQCGICTPGFIVALTGYTMEPRPADAAKAVDSMSGNICRCTGYKSIQRAAVTVANMLERKNPDNPIGWLVSQGFLPPYFVGIPERMQSLTSKQPPATKSQTIIGGGTDLMVQQADSLAEIDPQLLLDRRDLREIRKQNGRCIVGASATATDIMQAEVMRASFPRLDEFFFLISSEPIRNMGTVAGNIVNASPIADLVAFFLALDTTVHLRQQNAVNDRLVPLKDFFLGYKKLNKKENEIIHSISFPLPAPNSLFNFEKVSRRNTLDIASVNSALSVTVNGNRIEQTHLSIGGVAPIPLYLRKTSDFLKGKRLHPETLHAAADLIGEEISPISDVRGSKDYKRLLSRQLFFAHFLELFPDRIEPEMLLKKTDI